MVIVTTPPKAISQVLTVFWYELLKSIRTKKLYASIAVAVAVPLLLVMVPEFFDADIPNTSNEYLLGNLGSVFIIIVIVGSFFGSSSLASEFHEKTHYTLFPNPISRVSIWTGKFFASSAIAIGMTALYYCIVGAGTYYRYGEIPIEILHSFGASFLSIFMIMSISFLFSSFLKGPTGAMILVFILFIMVFPLVEGILVGLADEKPWFLPTFASKITEFVVIDPYPSDLKPGDRPKGPFDHHRYVPYLDESIPILVGYSVAFSIASIFVFKRR